MDNLLWTIVIGLVAGTLASQVIKGQRFGIAGNIAIGVLGAILGSFLFSFIGFVFGLVRTILSATLGAIILLALLKYWQTSRIR
jgi:uncharacterized membrane protein YeaQ/YmgE (transglycosylase-associated protein family)